MGGKESGVGGWVGGWVGGGGAENGGQILGMGGGKNWKKERWGGWGVGKREERGERKI